MPAKRIILMYISEVSGHRCATEAIEKSIKRLEPETEILNINAFNYTNPISEKVVNRLYMAIIKRTPAIWSYLYDNQKIAKSISRIKESIHKFNSPKLEKLFNSFKPDAVVCSQAFPCGMVADYKKVTHSSIPLIAVLTDYIPHAYWVYDDVNTYITPSEEVSIRLMQKGVPHSKIKPFGIPFDPDFNRPVNKDQVFSKLGLKSNKFTALIMGGGQGLGPVKSIISSLEHVNQDIQEIIVTGTNKKLYRTIKKKLNKYRKKVVLFGYANNINELMSIADVLITKPGGITTAEALSKHIPMIIVHPIPGQEASNTAYLTEHKAAIKIDKANRINLAVEELIASPEKLKELANAAKKISKPESSMNIARHILSLCNV
ncbi:MAG: hypothetical protein C4533_03360 [Candidatus Omnitrophota bacterium]|jgi:processive 1,2-diacylglycerol beta-glucosyltransferase|nr:MAG: hypothetical protein C4533_03360 [Candidatus Omnitrophota bacterium]